MILLDDRTGSRDLMPYFKPFGVKVELIRLDYGDACFPGSGPDGEMLVGVERKCTMDLVSSMRDRRLSGHQIPGMLETYAAVYLIHEGVTRPGDTGQLELLRRGWVGTGVSYFEVQHYLQTLIQKCGVVVIQTGSPYHTAMEVAGLYKWWQKPWEKHRAHRAIYAPTPIRNRARYDYGQVGLVEKVAAQLPGIDEKAREVGKKFASIREMALAGEREWRKVRGVGKVLAARIVESINGSESASHCGRVSRSKGL